MVRKSKAVADAFPIIIGYFSISVAFGILAKEYIGYNAILMSLMVFAGASQFIALQLIAKNTSATLIVATTFLVNLRHILMSSYFSPFYSKVNRLKKVLVSFGITDETFALASRRFQEGSGDTSYHLGLNFLCYSSWVGGTVVGLFFGSIVPASIADVLPFTLVALFISILVLNINNRLDIGIAVFSGVLATALISLPEGWNILVATLAACLVGGVAEQWTK
ncbi:MAG: AzlC family ABC transporter permease [Archaeoglobaceae archaeon]